MNNVHEIAPANLKSIPAMLRHWASLLESGREPMPRTAVLLCIPQGDDPPTIAFFGEEMSRTEEVGALYTVAQMHAHVELEPVNDSPAQR